MGVGEKNFDLQLSIQSLENTINFHLNKDKKTFENEYIIFYQQKEMEYIEKLLIKRVETSLDWRVSVVRDSILPLVMQNYLIEELKQNPNHLNIKEICNREEDDSLNKNSEGFRGLCGNTQFEQLEELYKKNISIIQDYEKMIEENHYYSYLEYQVNHSLIEKDSWIEQLIDQKVGSNMDHFLGLNYMQHQALENNPNNKYTKEHYKKINEIDIKHKAILWYSMEHGIKHDLSYSYFDNVREDIRYMNTKLKVNQVFHLSVIVMIIVSITSGGIVSKEHSEGTIKNIITAPIERWKILLSKFIYLILDTYIIWFLGLFILSICAGIQYGFHDLFTPKLIFTNGNVIEVNYYLFIIKNIFLSSIPIICYLSILFFLSIITNSTSLTVGITTALGIISPFLWLLTMAGNFKYIVYTPLWYFDCGFIFGNRFEYLESLQKIDFSLSMGIVISLIVTFLLYIISNITYIRRDIKN